MHSFFTGTGWAKQPLGVVVSVLPFLSHPPPAHDLLTAPGMARGLILQTDPTSRIEWLRRTEIKSVRVDDRFLLIRTLEPVRRDKQGCADHLWFQVDILSLEDAALLKALASEFTLKRTLSQ